MIKPYERYSMVIQWSDPDNTYIVTVPELPGCKTHGDTSEEAVRQGRDAIESWIEANRYWGRPIPEPRVLHELEESA
jgi:predicted RNase H-like HicB family nuclease